MKGNRTRKARALFLVLLSCVLLCLGAGAGETSERTGPPGLPPGVLPGWNRILTTSTPEERAIASRQVFGVNYFMREASLETREQDDFLLTAALLVQEAVSDGVVLTYPEE